MNIPKNRLPTLLCATWLASQGCTPALVNYMEASQIAPNRVVAMPPLVFVSTVDAGVNRTWQGEAAEKLTSQITRYLDVLLTSSGGHVASPDALKACGAECERFLEWGATASLAIAAHRTGIRASKNDTVADWFYRGDLASIRKELGADFVLFTTFKQTRETTGRKAANLLTGYHTYGKQLDVACIAELTVGHMAWCRQKSYDWADLADKGQAPKVLMYLLDDIFPMSDKP